ncbi:MAG: DUF4160 domain-containing protein [Candidatus Nanopelagicales bacterium]
MPAVASVDGTTIVLYYNDHPPPHFHARKAEHRAKIAIADQAVIAGSLPPSCLRKVVRWAAANNDLLANYWNASQQGAAIP